MADFNRFNVVYNGYDQYQVNNEIENLEFQIQSLNEKIVMYQNQIETINNQYSIIKQRYQMLVSEMSMREKAAEDVTRLALKEANTIIENAQTNADQIIQEAISDSQSLLDEVQKYNDESFTLKQGLKEYLVNFTNLLDKLNAPSVPDIQDKINELKSEE